ncbi:MAG: hypothetical protein AB7U20_20870 [Planctomycetaceae bacterium]
MSFRAGTGGEEMWPHCHRLGVAVIEYTPVDDVDLSVYAHGEPKDAWSQLASSQSASLKRFVYEMAVGDVIYAKQGPMIVGNGEVRSEYQFDKKNQIRGPDGKLWQHQRRVNWTPGFQAIPLQVGRPQIVTLVELTADDVNRIERGVSQCFADESAIEGTRTEIVQFRRERNQSLRNKAFRAANGTCCVCGRDFSKLLGGRGVRVLQVHHCKQLASSDKPTKSTMSDLAVVCANCHLLLHLDSKNALSIEDLRKLLKADGFLK